MKLDNNVIGTSSVYFEKIGNKNPKLKEIKLVGEILAMQVGFYCIRRISYSCQSTSDIMIGMIRKKINEYESLFGKEFINLNEEIIW